MIKLTSLHIVGTDISKGNKNFIDTEIDFTDSSKYCAFIGLNASGKSNLLEIISKIFAGLYKSKITDFKPDFAYIIKYTINTFEIEVELRKNPSELTYYFKINGESKNKTDFERNVTQYLPSKIIVNYSGEESRLWEEVYSKFYLDYLKNIKKNAISQNQMNYINKFNWDMALISLLFIEDDYTKELLGLENINSVKVKFSFDITKYTNYGSNPVIDFVKSINTNDNNEETIDLVTLKFNDKIIGSNDLEKSINLFNFLYIAYMPKDKKIIKDIEVQFNDITMKLLSEGQKKLILVRFITKLLADENSLILFDEPDSHIHVSRKEKLAELINESPAYSLLTTHSPALINFLDEKSVQLLKPHDTKGVEAIKIDKLKSIEEITENSMSIMEQSLIISSTKHILLCEGVNDINYIKKALSVLNRTKNNKYLALNDILMVNCGGADNVKPVFKEIIKDNLQSNQICIAIFDDDTPGKKNQISMQNLITSQSLTNVKTFVHPKIVPNSDNDFYMEDYFSIDAYKNKIREILDKAPNFYQVDTLQKAKSIINANYMSGFEDSDFENFHILFDKLLNEFNLIGS